MSKHGFFSPIAEYDGFDYASGRSFWRRRSFPSLLCEWLGEWFRGVRAARMGYSNWLYVQCSGGCMIPVDDSKGHDGWRVDGVFYASIGEAVVAFFKAEAAAHRRAGV